MARLTPRYSANRSEREYTEKHYIPAAAAYRSRIADQGAIGRQMADWRRQLDRSWATLRFGEVKVETRGGQHLFEAHVYLNGLDPKAVRVELYADGLKGGEPSMHEMKFTRELGGGKGGHAYSAAVSAARPPSGYTARLLPHFDGVAVPLEAAHITWQERNA